MARLLAEGTGARWTEVWLVVDGEPELAAAWPPEAGPGRRGWAATSRVCARTTSRSTACGSASCGSRSDPDQPLSPVEERLFAGLAAQAGLVLRGARLRVELAQRAEDLATLADDLQVSRRRVVDAHDSERRRLERDIHDGAQQHLVALVVNLRARAHPTAKSPDRARAVLAEQGAAVENAITSLVDLSRGIYPKVLTEDGVAAAVRDVVSTSTHPGRGARPRDRQARRRARDGPVLLLRRGGAERRQARRRHRIEVELAERRRPARAAGARRRARLRRGGASSRPAAWGTCATGWTRWAASSRSARTSPEAPTVVIVRGRRWPDVRRATDRLGSRRGSACVLAVVDTALVAASYPPFSTKSTGIHGWPLVNIAGIGSAVLGAVILGAHPRHPIGWILSFVGLTTSISLAAESYGIWVLQYDGPGSATQGHAHRLARRHPRRADCAGVPHRRLPAGPLRHVPRGRVALGRPRFVGGSGHVRPGSRPGRPERHQPQRRPHRRRSARAGAAQRRRRPDHADAPGERRRRCCGGSAARPARPASSSGSSRSGRPVSASPSSS